MAVPNLSLNGASEKSWWWKQHGAGNWRQLQLHVECFSVRGADSLEMKIKTQTTQLQIFSKYKVHIQQTNRRTDGQFFFSSMKFAFSFCLCCQSDWWVRVTSEISSGCLFCLLMNRSTDRALRDVCWFVLNINVVLYLVWSSQNGDMLSVCVNIYWKNRRFHQSPGFSVEVGEGITVSDASLWSEEQPESESTSKEMKISKAMFVWPGHTDDQRQLQQHNATI